MIIIHTDKTTGEECAQLKYVFDYFSLFGELWLTPVSRRYIIYAVQEHIWCKLLFAHILRCRTRLRCNFSTSKVPRWKVTSAAYGHFSDADIKDYFSADKWRLQSLLCSYYSMYSISTIYAAKLCICYT